MKRSLRIDAGGVPLHVEISGDGPPLLLGHGMLCTCRMFDRIVPTLAQTYQVICLDFSGHGASGPPPDQFDLHRLAFEYRAVLVALGVDRVHLAGFSMGGMAALQFALQEPDRFYSLTLMNTSAEEQPFKERQLLKILAALSRAIGLTPRASRMATHLMFSDAFIRERPDIAQAWRLRMEAMSLRAIAKTTALIAFRESVVDRLGDIRVPALVIGSDLDHAAPLVHSHVLAEHLPQARLITLTQTGHGSPVERPNEVLAHLLPFLKGATAGPLGPTFSRTRSDLSD
jgi:pimeloyl-ACP methyl ester carboxylesterase